MTPEEIEKERQLRQLIALKKQKERRILDLKKKQIRYKEEEARYLEKIRCSEEENKIFYLGHEGKGYLGKHGKWELNKLQKLLIKEFKDPKKKVFTYTGANRIGKTFITFILIYSCIIGRYPWEPEEVGFWIWELMNWKPPIKIRWIGQDWEKHVKGVLIPTIKELWPKSHPIIVKKNSLGAEALWTEGKYGGTIEIMSNKQESNLHEGWFGHFIPYDEPPTRDVRVANARGLVDTCGRELFSMTLLKEAWVHQEVINATLENGQFDPTVFNISGDINDNIGFGITQEGVDQFEKTLTEEQKDSRLRGVPSYLAGKILKFDHQKNIKDRFEIPSHWMMDIAIDVGTAKPHDIQYVATSPRGFKYVCFEETLPGDGTKIGESIIRRIENHKMRVAHIICDPLAKGDKNQESTTWAKIDNVLMKYNYYLELGSKDKSDGIILINDMLSSEFGEPSLYFFNDCVRSIMQCDGWMYDDQGLPKKYRSKELPGDDQCENLYRIALLATQYEEPNYEPEYQHAGTPDPHTGY